MAPADGEGGKQAPRSKPARKRPAAKPARPQRAAAKAAPPEWVDYSAESTSWDPWDDGGEAGDAEARGLNRTLGEWLEGVVPPEAQIHFFNAGREFAAGIQTTLDHHLNRGDEDGGGGAQALRIEIE